MKKLTVCVAMAILFSISLTAQTVPGISGARPAPQKERVELPAGVSQGWWAQVQKQIRADQYTVNWSDNASIKGVNGAWRANNPAQGFRTYFTKSGITIKPAGKSAEEKQPDWEWGLSLFSYGRPGNEERTGSATPTVSRNRMDYQRGSIQEWYINSEKGLEQGFILQAPPAGSGVRGEESEAKDQHYVYINLKLTGTLRPKFSEDGQAVDFYAGGNVNVLRYGELKATDATGTELPARFEPIPGGIRIAVDDRNAVYPVTVDPIASTPAWSAVGEAANDLFGVSVATAGDVNGDGFSDIIVGAYSNDEGGAEAGKVYLYTGSASGLSLTPAWSAVGEAAGDYFGMSVATAGDGTGTVFPISSWELLVMGLTPVRSTSTRGARRGFPRRPPGALLARLPLTTSAFV